MKLVNIKWYLYARMDIMTWEGKTAINELGVVSLGGLMESRMGVQRDR